MDLLDTRMRAHSPDPDRNPCMRQSYVKPSFLPVTIVVVFVMLVVMFPVFDWVDMDKGEWWDRNSTCPTTTCLIHVTESIPEGLIYPHSTYPDPVPNPYHLSTFEAWSRLLSSATNHVDMAAMYWTLRGKDVKPSDPSSAQGDAVFDHLVQTSSRGINLRIAQNMPGSSFTSPDSEYFEVHNVSEVRSLNFTALLGGGVLHAKAWIVDKQNFYVGSANMDWRSLTQVKELGITGFNCSCLASDLSKIWNAFWYMGNPDQPIFPQPWPSTYWTSFNDSNPMLVKVNGTISRIYFSVSPPPFRAHGREDDLDAILKTMAGAQKFINVAVMDYLPLSNFYKKGRYSYWPTIQDALISAAVSRGLDVKLLVSHWEHSKAEMYGFLKSMVLAGTTLGGKNGSIQVQLFTVPSNARQRQIPFARVNHNKYMVTDNAAYIGTSNWIGDYFTDTAGIGMVVRPSQGMLPGDNPVIYQIQQVFRRDWTSPYAEELLPYQRYHAND